MSYYKEFIKKTPVIGNSGWTPKSAEEKINNGEADLVAIARLFISNPDLPERIKKGIRIT